MTYVIYKERAAKFNKGAPQMRVHPQRSRNLEQNMMGAFFWKDAKTSLSKMLEVSPAMTDEDVIPISIEV